MGLTVTWKPNEGSSIVLNSQYYPIDDELSIDVEFSDTSVKRMQMGGEWPTFGYPGAAIVTCTGHIFGNTPSHFWTNRMAFLTACTPPNRELTARRHGTLTIADSDAAEPMFAYCRIVDRSATLEALYPMICPFVATFKAFEPYFLGVGSGREYVLG